MIEKQIEKCPICYERKWQPHKIYPEIRVCSTPNCFTLHPGDVYYGPDMVYSIKTNEPFDLKLLKQMK